MKRKGREICKVRNSILPGFSKQKQSLHYSAFSLTTRWRFIPAALRVKTLAVTVQKLPLQLFLLSLIRANTRPLPRAPASPSSGLRHRADHQAITRELGNPEEIQSLKGLNTGRGSGLVASTGGDGYKRCHIATIWQGLNRVVSLCT